MERASLKYLDASDQVSAAIKLVIDAGSEDVADELVPALDAIREELLRQARNPAATPARGKPFISIASPRPRHR